ncbi:hypothetical protein EV186_104118 [Labedaea rhizosphaerae]|uniref:Uncharacterized protein n=2 Tax=Labedaea rhizosphaerae TaxID=598644 RepID=A0A4V6PVS6_LABRH|nr:hypothetical protein EV186_104118 [Labedaea rhizosphaerae]
MTLLASAAVSVVRVPERRSPHQVHRAPVPFLTRRVTKPAAAPAEPEKTPAPTGN